MCKKTGNVIENVVLEVGHAMPFTSFNFGDSRLCFRPDGTVTFTGNADEAAQKFFDEVVKKYVHHLEILRNENARLSAQLKAAHHQISPPVGLNKLV